MILVVFDRLGISSHWSNIIYNNFIKVMIHNNGYLEIK